MAPWRFEGANNPNQKISIVPVAIGLFSWRGGGSGSGRRRGGAGSSGGGRRGGGGRLRLRRRIDPAGMDPSAQAIRHLGIDRAEEAHQAAESRLDVTARAAKAVVQIEVTKRGVEIVAPHQDHHPATKPDAFGISGRTIDGLRGFDEFVGLALSLLGGVGRGGGICCRRLGRLILAAKVAALGKSASYTNKEYQPGHGKVVQNRIFNLKYPSTHKFPDLFPAPRRCLMTFK
jgi:hypothetical protein